MKKRGHQRTYYIFPESSGVYRGKDGLHIKTVRAYTTCTPGLVVTRRIGHKDWNLTHEGMGLAIITGTSKRAAYLFAGILGAICEWDDWDSTNHDKKIEYSKKVLQETGWYDWLRSVKNG